MHLSARKTVAILGSVILVNVLAFHLIGSNNNNNNQSFSNDGPISSRASEDEATSRNPDNDGVTPSFSANQSTAISSSNNDVTFVDDVTDDLGSDVGSTPVIDVLLSRARAVKRKCSVWSLPKPVSQMMSNVYILKEKDFMWCAVFKAASTSWMEKLVQLSGRTLPKSYDGQWPIERAKAVSVKGSNGQVLRKVMGSRNRTSLLIVRHPFERIVAAFRDKLERTHGDNMFYKKRYGDKIVKRFRTKATRHFGSAYFDRRHNYGAVLPVIPESRRTESDALPSFWEFVQYLLVTIPAAYDEHWRPIARHCSLCQRTIVYDYVMKVEHLAEEEPAFLNHMGYDIAGSTTMEAVGSSSTHKNQNQHHNLTSSQITELYFRDISDEDVKRLYKIYSADFQLFDYRFERGDLKLPSL